MFKKQNKEINYVDFSSFNNEQNKLLEELIISKLDLIIDCSKIIPKESFIIKLAAHQKKITKCFVVIISSSIQNKFINNFNFVPTKKEAFDFVYFEQIQRDLGLILCNLTILGCHSATPRENYHTSSQLLKINENLFLIDCGEGTQIQLRKAKVKFSKIKHIFISHLHGDHFYGLIGLISTFRLLGREG